MEPIPVERLTRPLDAFRCLPLAATITARTCLARRGATYTGGRNDHAGPTKHTAYAGCAACELGAEVAERVEAEAPKGDRCEACGVPVKGAKGRRPLCAKHRRSAR